jgi:hypothetical protein
MMYRVTPLPSSSPSTPPPTLFYFSYLLYCPRSEGVARGQHDLDSVTLEEVSHLVMNE